MHSAMKRLFLFFLLIASVLFSCFSVRAAEIPVLYSQVEPIPETIELIPLTGTIFQVRGTRRLVNNYQAFPPEQMTEVVDAINAVLDGMEKKVPTYFYFSESARSHPVAHAFPEDSDAYLFLKDRLHVDHVDHLKYDTYEQFCRYFYATDHHWSYEGSYQAYVDVVRMLKGEDEEVLKPSGIAVFPFYFDGSFSKDMKLEFSRENFAIYNFTPFPSYTSWINGKKKAYDRFSAYLNGKYNAKPMVNHYGSCYGGDYGMIDFQGEKSGKGTLLMFGNSFSNAVKTLLIHHYDRIVYVDLRHYEGDRGIGKPFSMSEIMNEYAPDQILFLGDAGYFVDIRMKRINP